MTHQTRRGPPPLECPLASLGRSNSPSPLDSQPYLHPLSASPLNPQVYQLSRKSPMLSLKDNDRIFSATAPPSSATNRSLKPSDRSSSIHPEISDAYHLSRSSSDSMDQPFKIARNLKQAPTKYHRQLSSTRTYTPIDSLLQYRNDRTTTPSAYLLNDGTSNTTEENHSTNIVVVNHNDQYFLEEKMDSLYIQGAIRGLPLGSEMNHYKNNERYFLEESLNGLCDYNRNDRMNGTVTPQLLQRPSSPSETSGSDRYLIDRARGSPAFVSKSRKNHNSNGIIMNKRFPLTNIQCFTEGLSNFGRFSPNLDQGYATLVSPSPTSHSQHHQQTHQQLQQQSQQQTHPAITAITALGPWTKKGPCRSGPVFDRLSDDVIMKIFSWLDSSELCNIARVCRRFESIAWRSNLWKIITLAGEHISGDKALKMIFRRLCGQSRNGACPDVERVMLTNGCRVSDKGLQLLARRCPELTHLQTQSSINVSNQAMCDVLTKCTNLQHLDVTGCLQITNVSVNPSLEPPRRLLLQYLDLTDCTAIDDAGLKIIVRNCPQLVFLYLRRCVQITDAGLKFVPSFCIALKELSVSDCTNITDFGLYELAKLGSALRYLSVAKCDRVSDAGLKVIARRCYKLRYLNARGCEAVSDDSITVLARSCPRLRALDIGKCDVSDAGLRALAESCPNLKKLSLRNCDMITDRGVQCIAYYCRGLQQLNIQDCSISVEGYRAVKKYCKRCVIEHTNPGFC